MLNYPAPNSKGEYNFKLKLSIQEIITPTLSQKYLTNITKNSPEYRL
jgi:hypothetical protein